MNCKFKATNFLLINSTKKFCSKRIIYEWLTTRLLQINVLIIWFFRQMATLIIKYIQVYNKNNWSMQEIFYTNSDITHKVTWESSKQSTNLLSVSWSKRKQSRNMKHYLTTVEWSEHWLSSSWISWKHVYCITNKIISTQPNIFIAYTLFACIISYSQKRF